jgi:hypothetical protein
MMGEMEDLYRLMQSAMATMQVLMQNQPTDDELAAMQGQLQVVAHRMAQLQQRLPTTTVVVPAGGPSPSQVRDLIYGMQQAGQLLGDLLAEPTVDDATLAQLQPMLGELQDLMGQVQGEVAQIRTSEPWSGTLTSNPTPGSAPDMESSTRPGDGQPAQTKATLSQLEQMTRQLHTMVLQMQSAPGSGNDQGSTGAMGAPLSNTPTPGPAGSSAPTVGGSSSSTLDKVAGQVQELSSMMSSMMSMMSSMMGGMGGSSGNMAGGTAAPANGFSTPGSANSALMRQVQAGGVTVSVTPLNLRTPGLASLDFYVRLETHSGDLSQDLTQLAVLQLPSGTALPAARWVGPRAGHHVEGTLSFSALDSSGAPVLPTMGTLTLVMRNLGGDGDRTFSWDLSQLP